jgi:hypothetical protein
LRGADAYGDEEIERAFSIQYPDSAVAYLKKEKAHISIIYNMRKISSEPTFSHGGEK